MKPGQRVLVQGPFGSVSYSGYGYFHLNDEEVGVRTIYKKKMVIIVRGVTGMSHVYGLINSATEMEDRT
jgi:NAD(P)H-flavin reductase